MFNFLGVSSNLSVLAGTRWQSTFRFMDAESGAVAGLDGVTFAGVVYCDGQDFDIELTLSEADSERNTVLVSIPPLPEGRWEYEIWLTADTGEKVRLLEGRISALGKLVAVDQSVYAHRTLNVLLPGDVNKRVQLEWQASTVAVQAMNEALRVAEGVKGIGQDAKDALESAKEALEALDGVDDLVDDAEKARDDAEAAKDGAEAVLDSAKELIANAPREFIPTIVNGYWHINGEPTPHKAIGEDGVDGTRVVKHLVDDVEDIPTSGDTCNSGHVYYVNVPEVIKVLENKPSGTGEWDALQLPKDVVPHGVLLSGFVVPAVLSRGSASAAVYAMEGDSLRSLLSVSKYGTGFNSGVDVCWEFAEPFEVPEGCGVAIYLAQDPGDFGSNGVASDKGVQIQSAMRNSGVCKVRYHGLWYPERTPYVGFISPYAGKVMAYEWFDERGWVCLAGNGAQASRPATATEDGTVKLGTEVEVEMGAPVGKNAFGQMVVPQATTLCSGTVMYSTDEVIEGGIPIGRDRSGRIVALGTNVAPAQAFSWGTVKIGTSQPQSMGMPFIIPVGMAASGVRNEYGQDITGQLFNNTVPGGALRTMVKADWMATGISGWDIERLPDGSNAVGILANPAQFDQTTAKGLVLKPATVDSLAGVTLTANPLDERPAYVMDAATTHLFYHTRSEIETLLKGYIQTNSTLLGIKVMQQAEYDKLDVIDAHTLYLVY